MRRPDVWLDIHYHSCYSISMQYTEKDFEVAERANDAAGRAFEAFELTELLAPALKRLAQGGIPNHPKLEVALFRARAIVSKIEGALTASARHHQLREELGLPKDTRSHVDR